MPYRLAPQWADEVRAEIKDLLQAGIIVQSTSPWSAAIVPIRKPDGSVRLCVGFRKLNAHTAPDPYYIPLVEELIDKIGEAKYSSKLDLAKGFYQVEDSRMKTAFLTPFGKYEFTRMPFGLSNAPFTFQRLMDVVLSGLEKFASPYLDDTIVYSKYGLITYNTSTKSQANWQRQGQRLNLQSVNGVKSMLSIWVTFWVTLLGMVSARCLKLG